MKKKPTPPARLEISWATIQLNDGRVLRKETDDPLWHLYEKPNATGYRRLQQGEVRELLGALGGMKPALKESIEFTTCVIEGCLKDIPIKPPRTQRKYYCKHCGHIQHGHDCDEMQCAKCGCCDWSPR